MLFCILQGPVFMIQAFPPQETTTFKDATSAINSHTSETLNYDSCFQVICALQTPLTNCPWYLVPLSTKNLMCL